MPLRIRTETNKLVRLDKSAKFVEVITDDGDVVAVTYIEKDGTALVLDPGSPELKKYCKLYQATPAKKLREM